MFVFYLYFPVPKNTKEGAGHWLTERIVAVALLGAIPAGAIYPSPLVDHCLSVLLPLHAYWYFIILSVFPANKHFMYSKPFLVDFLFGIFEFHKSFLNYSVNILKKEMLLNL